MTNMFPGSEFAEEGETPSEKKAPIWLIALSRALNDIQKERGSFILNITFTLS